MQSKISLWNKRIILKDIRSCWPLWAAEIFFGVFGIWIMSFEALQAIGMEYQDISTMSIKAMSSERKDVIASVLLMLVNPILIAGLSIIVAILVFRYMYKKREAYMMNSFPVRKETMFISHCTAGFLMILIPGLLAYLGEFVFNFYYQIGMGKMLLAGMFESIVILLFFWSLSCFVITISGNGIMAGVIYAVLNMLEAFICLMLSEFSDILTSVSITQSGGLPEGVFTFFSPIVYLYNNAVNGGIQQVYYRDTPREIINLGNIGSVCLYLLPTVLFIGVSIFFYKKRKAEKIGDMVAFSWIEVVFRAVFTVCGACLFTIFFCLIGNINAYFSMWNRSLNDLNHVYTFVVVAISFGAAISFCISEMILKKRFMIWKKIPYLQFGIIFAVLLSIISLIRFEVFQPKIPAGEDIEAVEVYCNQPFTFAGKDIEKVREIQREMYTDFDKDYGSFDNQIDFTYYEKNGTEITFRYPYDSEGVLPEKKNNVYDFLQKQGIDALFLSDRTQMEQMNCTVNYQGTQESYQTLPEITDSATLDKILSALEQDYQEGNLNLSKTNVLENDCYMVYFEYYPTEEFAKKYPVISQHHTYAERRDGDVLYNMFYVDKDAFHTQEVLMELEKEKQDESGTEGVLPLDN